MFNLLNRFHNFIVLLILIVITLSCWFYTITGIGMNMSAWKMTLMNLNINDFSNSNKRNQVKIPKYSTDTIWHDKQPVAKEYAPNQKFFQTLRKLMNH